MALISYHCNYFDELICGKFNECVVADCSKVESEQTTSESVTTTAKTTTTSGETTESNSVTTTKPAENPKNGIEIDLQLSNPVSDDCLSDKYYSRHKMLFI